MSNENAAAIVDKALANDPASIIDLVRLELSGRARDVVNAQGELPLKIKTKEEETE